MALRRDHPVAPDAVALEGAVRVGARDSRAGRSDLSTPERRSFRAVPTAHKAPRGSEAAHDGDD